MNHASESLASAKRLTQADSEPNARFPVAEAANVKPGES